jgi:hypothetical protein
MTTCVGTQSPKYLEMAQGYISLSISPFLVIYANTKKQLREVQHQCKWEHNFVLIQIWHIWIILCHHLVLFLQIKLNFLSLSQTHLLRHKESCSKRNWSKISKTPPISHNKIFSPQEINFWQKETFRILTNQKVLTLLFSKFSSGSWSIYCFGLIFSPFGIKHQNGINLGP